MALLRSPHWLPRHCCGQQRPFYKMLTIFYSLRVFSALESTFFTLPGLMMLQIELWGRALFHPRCLMVSCHRCSAEPPCSFYLVEAPWTVHDELNGNQRRSFVQNSSTFRVKEVLLKRTLHRESPSFSYCHAVCVDELVRHKLCPKKRSRLQKTL